MPMKMFTGFAPIYTDFPEVFWALFYGEEYGRSADVDFLQEVFPKLSAEDAQKLIDMWNHKEPGKRKK